MKTFIIAEAGVNHNGDSGIAFKLIDVAAEAGADAVKFQTFSASKLVTHSASKAKYQVDNTGTDEPQIEMLKRLELSPDAHRKLISYCRDKNILFMSTPFDEESADMLDDSGMTIFKVPSGEITNKPFIQYIAAKNKSVILSTGMSYLGEVEKAVMWVNEVWSIRKDNPQLTLLHCVSNYPALIEDVNLLAMKTMETAFGLPVGYSDHSLGTEISIAAVAMGAKVIEKHFTLDKNMDGPDHKVSLDPDELKAMIKAIRNVEKAMGDGIKRPVQKEEDVKVVVRRSLVAARDIKRGEIIDKGSIVIKRPGSGIPPELLANVVNREARSDIEKDALLKWDDF